MVQNLLKERRDIIALIPIFDIEGYSGMSNEEFMFPKLDNHWLLYD